MAEYTFVAEKICPICEKSTRVVKTKSRLVAEKRDEDFCVHYKGFNPYYYRIWFCEHCGYAADEKTFLGYMPEKSKERLREFLSKRNLAMEFTEVRGVPEAVASYQLAIHYLELVNAPASKLAGRYLEWAWIYRSSGEKEKEMEKLKKAADLYNYSIMTERYPIGDMSDTMALYLVGAIYYRMGDLEKCTQYLSRIIGDQSVRSTDPKLYDRTRYLWQDVRALQGVEEPDEKQKKKKK